MSSTTFTTMANKEVALTILPSYNTGGLADGSGERHLARLRWQESMIPNVLDRTFLNGTWVNVCMGDGGTSSTMRRG